MTTNRNIFQKIVGATGVSLLLFGCGGLVDDSDANNNKSGIEEEYFLESPNFRLQYLSNFSVSVSKYTWVENMNVGIGSQVADGAEWDEVAGGWKEGGKGGCIVMKKSDDTCPTIAEFTTAESKYTYANDFGMDADCFIGSTDPGYNSNALHKKPDSFTDTPSAFGTTREDYHSYECWFQNDGSTQYFINDGNKVEAGGDHPAIDKCDGWNNGACIENCRIAGRDRANAGYFYVTELCFPVNTNKNPKWYEAQGSSSVNMLLDPNGEMVVPNIRFVAAIRNGPNFTQYEGQPIVELIFETCDENGAKSLTLNGTLVNNQNIPNDYNPPYRWVKDGNDRAKWVVESEPITQNDKKLSCGITLVKVVNRLDRETKDLSIPVTFLNF